MNNTISQLTYRVTGLQSEERLDPLIQSMTFDNNNTISFVKINSVHDISQSGIIDFVWETFSEKNWRHFHNTARVLNRLHNTQVTFHYSIVI
jgi:hypothetical protein